MVLIACAQICSSANILKNLESCVTVISRAAKGGAQCVFLPEASDFIGANMDETLNLAKSPDTLKFVEGIQDAAKQHNVEVNVCVHETIPGKSKLANMSLWINSTGVISHKYQKLHLFDVEFKDGLVMKESNSTIAGSQVIKPFASRCGSIGMAICFDLRFPELGLRLKREGAEILLYPSAFATRTGVAHWETLLRARAIENSCYVIASAQAGAHNSKRSSYGHAMVIDPWGTVIAQANDVETTQPTFVLADIDKPVLDKVREAMPLLRRTDVFPDI